MTGGSDADDTDGADGADNAEHAEREGPAVRVRRAREGDILAVLRVVEGAMLEVGANQVRRRTESGDVLVAEREGRVVGALVRDGDHVEAIAVHPDRRGAGVGSLLVERALAESGRLTAEFREEVRPFYEALAFDIEEREGEKRLWGERER
ncbi:GNAT family N-acetyltransferase [Salinigranum sp.]|uniref:GNAT family N-acetyltransferase n=1 Tax=Salinigranum sp. TaxID=1966351 RepID=UPI003569CFC0